MHFTSPRLTHNAIVETEKDIETANQSLVSNSARLDELQAEQLKNSRGILQAQKTAERYIVKRQTLTNRKEECSKSIRDLGVLPGEAYQKYTKETQPEKVSIQIGSRLPCAMLTVTRTAAGQEAAQSARTSQRIFSRQQEGFRTIHDLYQAAGRSTGQAGRVGRLR